MDGQSAHDPLSSPPGVMPDIPGQRRPVPEGRAVSDAKYNSAKDLLDALPKGLQEGKLAIYPARASSDTKEDPRYLKRLTVSTWKEQGLMDLDTLREYLRERWGEGRFLIEPQDAQGRRMDKMGHYIIDTHSETDDMPDRDDEDDRPRNRRRSRRSRDLYSDRDDDDDDVEDIDEGDEGGDRANMADLLVAATRGQARAAQAAASRGADLATTMMVIQTTNQQAREEADRRREEAAEMRRKEEREEQRRREEREDTQRREDERRREDKAKEERQAEQRHHEEAVARANREAEDRRAEQIKQMEIQAQRDAQKTQLVVGLVTAAVPILAKLFEPKPNTTMETLLASLLAPKPPDPVLQHLLTKVTESPKSPIDPTQMMMSVMQGVMQIQQQGTQAAMQSGHQMQAVVMEKALEAIRAGGAGGQPSTLETILQSLPHMAQLAQVLVPGRAAPVPAAPAIAAPTTAAPAATVATTAPVTTAASPPADDGTTGLRGSLHGLRALSLGACATEDERQRVMRRVIDEMGPDMRLAICRGDETAVMSMAAPVITGDPLLMQWMSIPANSAQNLPSTVEWLRAAIPQLAPSIISLYGPVDKQVADAAALAAAPPVAPAAPVTSPATTVPEPVDLSPPPMSPVENPNGVPVRIAGAAADDGAPVEPVPSAAGAPVLPEGDGVPIASAEAATPPVEV